MNTSSQLRTGLSPRGLRALAPRALEAIEIQARKHMNDARIAWEELYHSPAPCTAQGLSDRERRLDELEESIELNRKRVMAENAKRGV